MMRTPINIEKKINWEEFLMQTAKITINAVEITAMMDLEGKIKC